MCAAVHGKGIPAQSEENLRAHRPAILMVNVSPGLPGTLPGRNLLLCWEMTFAEFSYTRGKDGLRRWGGRE